MKAARPPARIESDSPMRTRKRFLALLIGLLTLALVALGFGLALTTGAPSEAAGSAKEPTTAPTTESDDTDLTTLALTGDETDAPEEETPGETAPGASAPGQTAPGQTVPEQNVPEETVPEETDGEGDGEQLPTLPADTDAPIVSWQLKPAALVKAGTVVHIRPINQGEPDGSIIDKSILLDGNIIGNVVSAHRNYDFQLDTAGLQDGVHVLRAESKDAAGNTGFAVVAFVIDGTGPTITVKPTSVGAGSVFSDLDLKLFDANQIDYAVVNGVTKPLTNNDWSDVNDIVVGSYGIQSGVPFTVVAFDVAGNSTTATFTIDASGPTITVKTESPASIGGPTYYSLLNLKLYDAFQIDKAVINGWTKELTNNAWSDVNDIKIGAYGIQDGVPFTVTAYDVAGNSTTKTFTLDGTAPTVSWQLLPEALETGSEHWRFIVTGEPAQLFNKVTYIDGQIWDAFNSDHFNRDIVVDTTLLSDGVHTAQGVIYDEAGNRGETPVVTFTVDNSGPTITVKTANPASVGGPDRFSTLSLKLYDANKVDKVVVNGVLKDLTNDNYSDVNFLAAGSFGIQEGVPFTVVAYDVQGNSSSRTFVIDTTAPTVGWQVTPKAIETGAAAWRFVVTNGTPDVYNKTYILDGSFVLANINSDHYNFDYSFNSAKLADGQHTVYGVACDQAGNCAQTETLTFTVDNSGPQVTTKAESTKLSLSLKLYDPNSVAYAIVNGVTKDLSDNQWSDLNDIKVGDFGIVKNVAFLVKVYDVQGNVTTTEYTLTATGGGSQFEPLP